MKIQAPSNFIPIPGTESANEPEAGPVYFIDVAGNYDIIRMLRSKTSTKRHNCNWKRLRCPTDKLGYRRVKIIYTGGRVVSQFIHTLVLEIIKGEPRPAGMFCRHLDGNSKNNNPDNLKWGTRRENDNDRIRHRREKKGPIKPQPVPLFRFSK